MTVSTALPFLAQLAQAPPDAPALCDDDAVEWVTYGELRRRVDAAAERLRAPTRSLIFCIASRTIAGATAYLAAVKSGHAVMVIEPDALNFETLLACYRPHSILAPPGWQTCAGLTHGGVTGDLAIWRSSVAPTAVHDDLCLLLPTSGSTGGSRMVRLSYGNISHNTAAIVKSLNLTSDACSLLHLPLSYSFGLSVLHSAITAGGRVVLTEKKVMEQGIWEIARRWRANLFPGVPFHYDVLARLGLENLRIPEMRIFLQAGGQLAADITLKILISIKARDGQFFVLYGQTEAAPRMACLPLHERPEKLSGAGFALDGGRFTISEGEVIYDGPNVMLGYATSDADLMLGDTQHGQLATGDMGRLDDEGCLFLTGRQARFAKVHGNRVALEEIENIVGKVLAGVAFADDARVTIVVATDDPALLEIVRRKLLASTSLPSSCFDLRSVATLPRLANGKFDYQQMRSWL